MHLFLNSIQKLQKRGKIRQEKLVTHLPTGDLILAHLGAIVAPAFLSH